MKEFINIQHPSLQIKKINIGGELLMNNCVLSLSSIDLEKDKNVK